MEEVPHRTSLVPLAFLCFVLCLIGVETEGILDYQGRAGIISIVRWNLRPVIFGVDKKLLALPARLRSRFASEWRCTRFWCTQVSEIAKTQVRKSRLIINCHPHAPHPSHPSHPAPPPLPMHSYTFPYRGSWGFGKSFGGREGGWLFMKPWGFRFPNQGFGNLRRYRSGPMCPHTLHPAKELIHKLRHASFNSTGADVRVRLCSESQKNQGSANRGFQTVVRDCRLSRGLMR